MRYTYSLSGGKDSTAMVLMAAEKGLPIDDILYCDTGMEFPEMYAHIKKLEKYLRREITILKAKNSFEYYMFEKPKKYTFNRFLKENYSIGSKEWREKRKKNEITYKEHMTVVNDYKKTLSTEQFKDKGLGWPTFQIRWCTSMLKLNIINKYTSSSNQDCIQYVGIAADEINRTFRLEGRNVCYPLVESGITERQALEYCYNKGFYWDGLYTRYKRVSCWCCPLQSLNDLYSLYCFYPDLWIKLREMDARAYNHFRMDYTLEELERIFRRKKYVRDLERTPLNLFA